MECNWICFVCMCVYVCVRLLMSAAIMNQLNWSELNWANETLIVIRMWTWTWIWIRLMVHGHGCTICTWLSQKRKIITHKLFNFFKLLSLHDWYCYYYCTLLYFTGHVHLHFPRPLTNWRIFWTTDSRKWKVVPECLVIGITLRFIREFCVVFYFISFRFVSHHNMNPNIYNTHMSLIVISLLVLSVVLLFSFHLFQSVQTRTPINMYQHLNTWSNHQNNNITIKL